MNAASVCVCDNRELFVFKIVAPILFGFSEASVGVAEGNTKSTASFFPGIGRGHV